MTILSKAKALGYTRKIDSKDNSQLAELIYWIEVNIIQTYTDSNRQFLKDVNAKDWPEHLNKYAIILSCPTSVTNVEGQVDWVLNYAIQLAYEKKKDEYNKYSVGNLKTSNVPNVVVDNVLDHLDFTSKEFQECINKLAKILNIPSHNDPTLMLKACRILIQTRLHKEATDKPEDYIVRGTPFPYKSADPGFDLKDEALMEAAKVLRLLYISDLRMLQTKVNECIVAVQSVTANPKTDTKLGQVGK